MAYIFGSILLAVLLWINFVHYPRAFRRDEYNPYRRYCTCCGQRQEYHTMTMKDRYGWWEDMGLIEDKLCSCHKASEYHS